MSALDWGVLAGTLGFIVLYGTWYSRKQVNLMSFIMADKSARWWTVGLSVIATQASAITFLSTPGQAYHDGMGFVQFYFGQPLAIIVICIMFIPIYHRLKVYTAYEYLESRFDLKTRTLAASLFLIQRGLGAGITIYAPAIILTSILGWNLNLTVIIIGVLVILYTVTGGTKAVNVTHKQQMFVIMVGLFVVFYILLDYLPNEYTFSEILKIAGANEKMNILSFDVDPTNRYTIWSGLTGGFFLALAYFGTDQSQVQRYLSAKSVRESRLGLIVHGLVKVPMQFFILLLGILVFVFYQFHTAPIFFNAAVKEKIYESEYAMEFSTLESRYQEHMRGKLHLNTAFVEADRNNNDAEKTRIKEQIRQVNIQEASYRQEAKNIIARYDFDIELNDKDYVFINFILENLPKGLIGLLLAMILSAAMSSTASELNALAATSTVDIYKRSMRKEASEKHYLNATKFWTVFWGIVAILFASIGSLFENLIQFVNIVGSMFYGTILGIFLVAFQVKWVRSNAVFLGALIAESIVLFVHFGTSIGYLWLNVIGCAGVFIFSMLIQQILKFPKVVKP